MVMRVALSHETRYSYAQPATLSPQVVRLRPAPHTRTPLHAYSLHIEPRTHFLNWLQDPHGNYVARVVVPEKTREFVVSVNLVADLESHNPFDFFLEPYAERYPFEYPGALRADLEPFLALESLTPRLADFIESLDRRPRGVVDFLVDTNRAVQKRVAYIVRMEPGVQTPEETLEQGRGSCRDSGWLLTQVLRRLGLAARFVSGYLIQLKADQVAVDGPSGPGQDFTDLHAWCECYVPGAGWIGLDPTSGLLAAEGHIPLACSPAPGSASPIEGSVEKVEGEFSFSMSVTRVNDAPRASKPYRDEDWAAILRLGERVDSALSADDVRLTMGGEPTFVSAENSDADEWNMAALGGQKKAFADALLRRLHARWQPGGMLHHGLGKWYPGEQLPRWALSCFFRKDRVPLWNNTALLAESGRDYGKGSDDAERFARRLIHHLGLAQHGLMPAYEDIWYYLWRERRLPTNVDPLESRLEDAAERDRLARIFRQGLNAVVGWVLPLTYAGQWVSGTWFLRDEHCFLLPGDSPMGFRLPLDSLPWVAPADYDVEDALDPFAERGELPSHFEFPLRSRPQRPAAPRPQRRGAQTRPASTEASPFARPESQESATGITRTAVCVEPRAGTLRIFMPPLSTLDAYVELVAAVEHTAAELDLPVQLEGYPPPQDPRLGKFSVTPDPGVLEVNVPPVDTFAELVEQTESLYECARQEKLSPDKFELDGLHVGSGGGQHFVLGGATPADSPLLRRPDLLASLAGYYNNHPSLSYLFSGRFIGPTSQAPRADEARHESVYELELAFRQIPARAPDVPPWLVDRVFRHLLVDVTGNTHRAEFCIDKLYSPDGPSGRLGLVELRAFEMAPHPRMASLNALLARALVSAFWKEPYRAPLVRWTTSLHDRFMLPYFVWKDFREVLADLERHGFRFAEEWFAPQLDFRFPLYGRAVRDAVLLELRAALEPWPVLGEEATAAGQSRYVDSSLERLEVRAVGITEGRHRVLCNGVEVPLHPTGTRGEGVCGVRYRAWQPPSCLHPTIGVHGPLRFDLYDTWNERALFGCTYHVAHPGGRANLERPINASAAESRRLARFEAFGHTQGRFHPLSAPHNPHFPMTLDLRLVGADR